MGFVKAKYTIIIIRVLIDFMSTLQRRSYWIYRYINTHARLLTSKSAYYFSPLVFVGSFRFFLSLFFFYDQSQYNIRCTQCIYMYKEEHSTSLRTIILTIFHYNIRVYVYIYTFIYAILRVLVTSCFAGCVLLLLYIIYSKNRDGPAVVIRHRTEVFDRRNIDMLCVRVVNYYLLHASARTTAITVTAGFFFFAFLPPFIYRTEIVFTAAYYYNVH